MILAALAALGVAAEQHSVRQETGLNSPSRQNSTSIHPNHPGITLSPAKHSECCKH